MRNDRAERRSLVHHAALCGWRYNGAGMIYSGGPLEAEVPDIDLASFVLRRAGELGEKPALIDGSSGRALSYAQLGASVRSFAAGLAARLRQRRHVRDLHAQRARVRGHVSWRGCGRRALHNRLYTAHELGKHLADSHAGMLLTVPAFLDAALEAAKRAGGCEVFVLGDSDRAASFGELLGDPDAAPRVTIDPALDIAALPYSSGTTG